MKKGGTLRHLIACLKQSLYQNRIFYSKEYLNGYNACLRDISTNYTLITNLKEVDKQ